MAKLHTISTKILPEEKVAFEEKAAKEGMSKSEYLRSILLQSLTLANNRSPVVVHGYTAYSKDLLKIQGSLQGINKNQNIILKNNMTIYKLVVGVTILGCVSLIVGIIQSPQ